MTLNELNAAIIKWAEDREITKHSTAYVQAFKTAEEVQELIEAVADWRTNPDHPGGHYDIMDAVGDIYVTLIVGIACTPTNHREITSMVGQGLSGQKNPVGALQRNLVSLGKFTPQDQTDPSTFYCAAVSLMFGNLRQVADNFGTTLEACVEQAYNAIKDRKGKLLPNGIFVKEE